MKTELLKVNEESVALGARLIREGELVGFPTETVYGLGANALDARAVAKIFEAKGRPQDNPLITHVACVEEIPPLVRAIPAAARKLMEAFWPGPMTLILPKADCIPDAVSAGLDTVGIRLPANADARRLIRAAAHRLFIQSGWAGARQVIRLPSTSPAYTMAYEKKREAWRAALCALQIVQSTEPKEERI